MEIWKDIIGYVWLYMVSNWWRVKSLNYSNTWKAKILKQMIDRDWYKMLTLCRNNIKSTKRVHRLVLEAFVWVSELQCNHKDWIKANNRLENLEYCTCKHNIQHAHKMWLVTNARYWKWRFWKDNKSSKPIGQYKKDWELVKNWGNAREINRELWIDYRNISAVCNWARKTTWGFIFKFI